MGSKQDHLYWVSSNLSRMRVLLRTKVGWKSQSLKNFESSKNSNVYTFEGLAHLVEKKTHIDQLCQKWEFFM